MSDQVPGWDSHRAADDDIFTSPLWTDPSPALTDHHCFDVESCDPSPLLADDMDAPANDIAQMPLFGDMTLFSPAVRGDQNAPAAGVSASAGTGDNGHGDFSLFPEAQNYANSPPRGQMAFNPSATTPSEDPAAMLFRALQSAAAARQTQEPVKAASPNLISSPPREFLDNARPPLHHSATAPSLSYEATAPESVESSKTETQEPAQPTACRRGTKRRIGVEDLLPLDAPIQSRNYLGPSATSRRDYFPTSNPERGSTSTTSSSSGVPSADQGATAEELALIAAETDPLKAKRLSNTLAARRSRHRKVQEKAEFETTIAELRRELAECQERLALTEAERDELKDSQNKKRRCSHCDE
ncbi:unnamed protein product [Jaminaea pallidilutea]